MLTIEDLHWLDPAGIVALGHLTDLLADRPVLLLATYRLGTHRLGSVQSRAVADLVRHPQSLELRLVPLSVDAVAQLLGAEDRTEAAELHRRTGGNPFFVEALRTSTASTLPWTVTEVVAQHLAALDVDARALLEVMAVAAAPLTPVVLADLPEVNAGIGGALESGIALRVDDDAVALRHGIVGEVIRNGLPAQRLRELHHRLAEVLERQGDRAAEALARHWGEAGDTVRAAAWAAIAADHLFARRSFSTAAALYASALQHPPTDPEARASMLERAAMSAALAGDSASAGDWAAAAGRAHAEAGDAAGEMGSWTNPSFTRLMAEIGSVADHSAVESITRAQQALEGGAAEEARRLARGALATAREHDDYATTAAAALTLAYAGDPDGLDGCVARPMPR